MAMRNGCVVRHFRNAFRVDKVIVAHQSIMQRHLLMLMTICSQTSITVSNPAPSWRPNSVRVEGLMALMG